MACWFGASVITLVGALALGCASTETPVDTRAKHEQATSTPVAPSSAPPSIAVAPTVAPSSVPPPAAVPPAASSGVAEPVEIAAAFREWIVASRSKPVPRGLGDAIELRFETGSVMAGAKPKRPKSWRVRGGDELTTRIDEILRGNAQKELAILGGDIECAASCCTYQQNPDIWGGAGLVTLTSVCLTDDTAGRRITTVNLYLGTGIEVRPSK